MSRGYDSSSWMKLHCGDKVHRDDDPRHIGRVEAIHNSARVTVKWDDSGWFEYGIPLQDLIVVERAR